MTGCSPGMLKGPLIPDDHATLSEGCKDFWRRMDYEESVSRKTTVPFDISVRDESCLFEDIGGERLRRIVPHLAEWLRCYSIVSIWGQYPLPMPRRVRWILRIVCVVTCHICCIVQLIIYPLQPTARAKQCDFFGIWSTTLKILHLFHTKYTRGGPMKGKKTWILRPSQLMVRKRDCHIPVPVPLPCRRAYWHPRTNNCIFTSNPRSDRCDPCRG